MTTVVWVGIFGVLGVFFRWGLDTWAIRLSPEGTSLPWGILAANFVGTFVAGLVYALANERSLLAPSWALVLLVGFCGGFTTFSAYALQSLLLAQRGEALTAAVYFLGSPVLGLLGAYLGLLAARVV